MKKEKKVQSSSVTPAIAKQMLAEVKCPDCEQKVKLTSDLDTDWYGNLKYYRCKNCKETFVSQNGGGLTIAARH